MKSIDDDTEGWRMTVEEFRQFDGFQNISDEEAEKVIDTLVQLAKIDYEIMMNNIS